MFVLVQFALSIINGLVYITDMYICVYTQSIVCYYEHVVGSAEGNQWGREIQRESLQYVTAR